MSILVLRVDPFASNMPAVMKRKNKIERSIFFTAFIAVAGLVFIQAVGCGNKIGDSCGTNVDCAYDGSRICDVSSPGGYCTIEGCVGGSCPKEAVCVAFYAIEFLALTCNPETEDKICEPCDPAAGRDCNAYCDPDILNRACDPCDPAVEEDCNAYCEGELPTDDCLPWEICLGDGLCARRDTEKTYCMRKCSNSGDCRGGYSCHRTGSEGTLLVPKLGEPYTLDERGFCAPQ